jgi:uncharacterized membrane protein YcaP (DUF421 family)
MFFSSWTSLLRIVAVGIPLYVALVAFLRVSGKRTLSKMNAFDFVVTVALGSALATTLLSKQHALLDGLAAFVLLIALQYAITWSSIRSPRFRALVKNRPRILAFRGEVHAESLRRERVTEEELAAAIRACGLADVQATDAIIIETDGSIAVIPRRDEQHTFGALEHVAGVPK